MIELLQWWNLVFILPFLGAVMYMGLLATGTISDNDCDFDHDIDVDFDHDFGVGDHSVGHDMGVDHDPGTLLRALSLLGFGRVPISIIMISFCFIWGFTGWAANLVQEKILFFPILYFWISLGAAFVCSVLGTRFIAVGISKIMPATETYATKPRDLVGKRGVVRFKCTENSGSIQVRDNFKNLQEISCRIKGGDPELLSNTKIVVVSYKADERAYFVKADPLGKLKNVE